MRTPFSDKLHVLFLSLFF